MDTLTEYLDHVGVTWGKREDGLWIMDHDKLIVVQDGRATGFPVTRTPHLLITPSRHYVLPRLYRYAVPILRYLLKHDQLTRFTELYALAVSPSAKIVLPWRYAIALPPVYRLHRLIGVDVNPTTLHLYYRRGNYLEAEIIDRIYSQITFANHESWAQEIVDKAWQVFTGRF